MKPAPLFRPPDTREALEENSNRRLKLLQSLTDAFAVPDEFDERAVFGKKELETLSLGRLKGGIQQRVDLKLIGQRLAATGGLAARDEDGWISPANRSDFGFIAEAIERKKKDGYMPRHSLYVLLVQVFRLNWLTTT